MALSDIREISVPIQLDRERTLKFDLNAFAELEEHFGSMEAAFQAMQRGSMKSARSLLWAGLLHEDESLTERQVGAMVNMGNIHEVMDLIGQALSGAVPEADETTDPMEGNVENPTVPS